MPSKFFDEPQPAAVLKHGVLGRYLRIFVSKTGSAAPGGRVAYLDGYAGPGTYETGEAGSPAVAVETAQIVSESKRSVVGHFVEQDPDACDLLVKFIELEEEGLEDWAVYEGAVEDHMAAIEGSLGPRMPLFAFMDPFGLGVPMALLDEHLLRRSGAVHYGYRTAGAATEVLLNFSIPGLRRNAGHLTSKSKNAQYRQARELIIGRLDATLGGVWWQEIWRDADEADRVEMIFLGYLERLRELPGDWATFAIPVSDTWMGPPVYHLVLLTQHPDGLWQFNEVVSNAQIDYRSACHAARGELDVAPSEDAWVQEIKANISKLLDTEGSFVVGAHMSAVYGRTLGSARAMHVRKAIKELYQEQKTSQTGKGDIQRMTVYKFTPRGSA